MKLNTRDWLDNKELRRCSPAARGILADLMCLAHEGVPYGHLADKVGPLTEHYMASRCFVKSRLFKESIGELKIHGRIHTSESGVLFIQRMVEDEAVRVARASGGFASVGHPNTHPKKSNKGYPSDHPSVENDSPARTRADSVSVSDFKTKKSSLPLATDFQPFWIRWCTLTGRRQRESDACRAWISVVPPEEAAAAMACLERYGKSDELARGVVSNPDKWLFEQSRDSWKGDWPPARASPKPKEEQIWSDLPEFKGWEKPID